MPQYTTIQDSPAIIFSHPTWVIYFFIRVHVMHNYTKNKGLDLGKFLSSPNLTYMHHFSHCRNKLHAHHETHLHTTKVVMILNPSFHGLCQEYLAYNLAATQKNQKKKKHLHFQSLALLKQAQLITHNLRTKQLQ